MGQVLHGSATTTEAIRRAIQHSQESLRTLAKRHGINPKTVAKWKKRTSVADERTGPKVPKSTVLAICSRSVAGLICTVIRAPPAAFCVPAAAFFTARAGWTFYFGEPGAVAAPTRTPTLICPTLRTLSMSATKTVAIRAMTMPAAASVLPERAVSGVLRRLMP